MLSFLEAVVTSRKVDVGMLGGNLELTQDVSNRLADSDHRVMLAIKTYRNGIVKCPTARLVKTLKTERYKKLLFSTNTFIKKYQPDKKPLKPPSCVGFPQPYKDCFNNITLSSERGYHVAKVPKNGWKVTFSCPVLVALNVDVADGLDRLVLAKAMRENKSEKKLKPVDFLKESISDFVEKKISRVVSHLQGHSLNVGHIFRQHLGELHKIIDINTPLKRPSKVDDDFLDLLYKMLLIKRLKKLTGVESKNGYHFETNGYWNNEFLRDTNQKRSFMMGGDKKADEDSGVWSFSLGQVIREVKQAGLCRGLIPVKEMSEMELVVTALVFLRRNVSNYHSKVPLVKAKRSVWLDPDPHPNGFGPIGPRPKAHSPLKSIVHPIKEYLMFRGDGDMNLYCTQ